MEEDIVLNENDKRIALRSVTIIDSVMKTLNEEIEKSSDEDKELTILGILGSLPMMTASITALICKDKELTIETLNKYIRSLEMIIDHFEEMVNEE